MTPKSNKNRVHSLPNSTYLVETAAGAVLVNCPPETLKYILSKGLETPQIILIPPDIPAGTELGSSGFVRQGINYASVEFLLYANFFGKNRDARILAPTQKQVERLRLILDETFTGPQIEYYGQDSWLYYECQAAGYYPPLGRAPNHDDLGTIESLERVGGDLGHGTTVELVGTTYIFREKGAIVAEVSTDIVETPRAFTLAPPRPLLRHELTLQFIGGSDGFDPAGITTCFLAYLGRDSQTQATLFDTAAYLRMRLHNLGLSTRHLSEVVISHLHEDHLAGLPELLLMGHQRVRLLTADIIHQSLLRILSAMLNLPEDDVSALFDYIPLNPGHPITLEGRHFESIYAIHTIPTIAVRANGLYYSGDMRYDETWFEKLVQAGTLTPKRRDSLIHFAEGAEVLVQDAGGGAIHTTVTPELLEALAAKGQRIILAHTSQAKLSDEHAPWAGQVEFASSGHVSSMGALVEDDKEIEQLETLEACPLFARLPMDERLALSQRAESLEFSDGETIIRHGEESDGRTYIVHSGLVEIWAEGKLLLVIGRGSSIGERGALYGGPRVNTLIARGQVELLAFEYDDFYPIANRLGLMQALNRADWLWSQPLFKDLLWSTMLDLALDFQPRLLSAGESLFEVGDLARESYLLVSGRVKVVDEAGNLIDSMEEPGIFFGGRGALYGTLRNASARAARDTEVWALPLDALHRLQMVYPRILLHMRAVEEGRKGIVGG